MMETTHGIQLEFQRTKEQHHPYGCCPIKNIRWDGTVLKFDTFTKERKFRCELPYLNEKKFDFRCYADKQ